MPFAQRQKQHVAYKQGAHPFIDKMPTAKIFPPKTWKTMKRRLEIKTEQIK